MLRFRQKTTPKIFLLIGFLLNFVKLFKFYDRTLDFIFERTQISFNLDTVDFGINNFDKKLIFSSSETVNISKYRKNDLCVWFNFTESVSIPLNKNNPSLCLHGTINYAPLIFEHIQRWPSFISFALFIEDADLEALKLYKLMIYCYPKSRSFVSTHLVFKNQNCNKSTVLEIFKNNESEINCSSLKSYFKKYLYKFNRYSNTEYPINTLRNIARFGAKTEFLVNSDIENIFSNDAHLVLTEILKNVNQSEKEKTAIVIRRFEVSKKTDIPKNVQQLVKALKDKRVFTFHHQFYGNNHLIPKFDEWINKSFYSNQTFIQSIKYQFSWEPLTITHRSSPSYYEGLLYRYRNQMAYVYELCKANIKFVVASHIFTVHKGIKKKLSRNEKFYLQGNWKKAVESWKNFEQMIKIKYPDTDKKCDRI